MDNMTLYESFRQVPKEAKREIKGGRMSGKTDINPMWRIKVLTEQFGPCGIGWYYKPIRKWLEARGDEVAAFVDIELYVKHEGEWSMPISGTGGNMFVTKEKSGIHVSDECYKMATTDAISVACKQLGIGADVYWDSDSTKYTNTRQDTPVGGISDKEAEQIFSQLKRTGVGMKGLLNKYGLSDIRQMSREQYADAMDILKKKPDKAVDPATVPPEDQEGGLPWNAPER